LGKNIKRRVGVLKNEMLTRASVFFSLNARHFIFETSTLLNEKLW
jgi:hypothetical protein